MKPERHQMIGFLVGPLWPAALAAGGRASSADGMREIRSPESPARPLCAVVFVEFLVLMLVLGWLALGRPGLACAADAAQDGLSLPAGDVFVWPARGSAGNAAEAPVIEIPAESDSPSPARYPRRMRCHTPTHVHPQ